jgi:integrase
MSFELKSCLASEMNEYLDLLNNAEKDTEYYITTFKSLDSYLLTIGWHEKALTDVLLREWIMSLNCSARTKNGYTARMRKFSRYLTALNIPAVEPDFHRDIATYLPYTFSDKQFAAIVDVIDNFKANAFPSDTSYKFAIMFRVLYGCGLRVGEALALRWEDIDLNNGVIDIRKAKNNKQRRVPIKNSLRNTLAMYQERKFPYDSEERLLFANDDTGKPYLQNTFRGWFVKVLWLAKISNERTAHFERCISPHVLRHYFTFKSFMNAETEGKTIEEVMPYLSAYLGHESLFGTEKYLTTDYTVYKDSHKRVARAIETLFPEVCFE